MTTPNEQFTELQRKNMEAAMRLAQLSLDQSQRIVALQAEFAKQMFNDGIANAKALATAKTPQELLGLRTGFAQQATEKMLAATQQIAEISNEAREEFSRTISDQLASGRNELSNAFSSLFKSLPGGGNQIGEMVQKALDNANDAFEQIAKASNAALSSVNEAAKQASKPRKKAA